MLILACKPYTPSNPRNRYYYKQRKETSHMRSRTSTWHSKISTASTHKRINVTRTTIWIMGREQTLAKLKPRPRVVCSTTTVRRTKSVQYSRKTIT